MFLVPFRGPTMRIFIALLLAAAFGAPIAAAHAQDRKLPPVDEGAGDASWLRFKKRLVEAIERRDKQFLLSIVDKNIRNQDERQRGIANFRRQWELDTSDSPLWHELRNALQLGSAYMKREKGPRELCAPYLLGRWPDDIEPVKHGVVIARDAQVQPEPSNGASALGALSYDIVPIVDWEVDDNASDGKQKWVKIRYRN